MQDVTTDFYNINFIRRNSLRNSFSYIFGPLFAKLTPGMQGALWSETVRTSDELDYMIFPRLVALAERAWHKAAFEEATNVTSDDEWKSFARAVGEREFARLEKIGVKYRIPPPGGR